MGVLSGGVGLVYFGAGLVSLLLSVLGVRRRDRPGSRGFVALTAGIATWCLALSVPKLLETVPYSPAFFYLVMLAAQLTAIGWLGLVLEFSGRWPISRRGNVAIGLFFLLGQLLVWSNPVHELLLGPETEVSGAILVADLGPVFWALTAVEYLIIVGSAVVVGLEVRDSTGSRRTQSIVILLSTVPPFVASLVAVTEFGTANHDVVPFGFLLSEGLFAWGLYRGQFLELVPVARKVVVEEMPDAVLAVDGNDYLVDYNRSAAELFGLDETAIGLPISSVLGHDGLVDLVTAGEPTERELSMDDEAEPKHVLVTVTPLDVPDARGSRVTVIRDITPLKEREQELRQREADLERQNARLDRFTGIVSHDLRNPLNVASGHLELAQEVCETAHLEDVETAHDRMEALIETLLTLARQGHPIEDPERVTVSTVARQSWDAVDTRAASLTVEGDLTLLADPDRLQQLLENLFRNAVEHGGEDVDVRVGVVDDRPGVFVADDGSGLPEEHSDVIFDSGYSTLDRGTGFGLDIVSEIVDAHGWQISATDSRDGGARFEITDVDVEE